MRRIGLVLVAAMCAAGVAVVHADGGGAAEVTARAERIGVTDRALLISDSAWLGIHFYGTLDAIQGFHHTLALASCRRRVVTSCRNYDGSVPPTLLETLNDLGPGHDTLIVATGYNDDDRAFAEEFRTIVDTARRLGFRRIVWLTLRTAGVTYESPDASGHAAVFTRSNRLLVELVGGGDHPDVVIADWAAYAADRREWFSSDGIHLRRLGTYAASDYISRKMAWLDARPCPLPLVAGGRVAAPCPDPDLTGPATDLSSVYPLDRSAPLPGFRMEFVGHGSWPDPPWWER
ncbi:MAG: hypothetical protein ACO3WU_09445 [Ilumatobacteraceae bacterium]